jgi:pimeloyl-CoA dehydrogenase small subunit
MDFAFSEEQRLLSDSLGRLLADHYGFEKRQQYAQAADGWSRAVWQRYAELGLLGLPFAERYGGFGGGAVEIMIVAEAFGRALALEPFVATVLLGGGLVRHGGSEAQCEALLPKVAEGSMVLAFAHTERQARYDLSDVATTARAHQSGFLLDGAKSLVLHGESADRLLVSARVAGDRRDHGGIGVFLVDAAAAGVSRTGYQTIDGQRAAEVILQNVRVEADAVIGQPEGGFDLIVRVVDETMAALCAEAVGAMTAMHELTIDYLKTRRQFGMPIGSFQVLQHRAVDMLVALEQARSMALFATMMVEEGELERHTAIGAAKVAIGRAGRLIGQQAIQLHGGIGMTMEYKVGHYFKRVTAIDTMFGDADHHLLEVARAGGVIDPRERPRALAQGLPAGALLRRS